MDRSRYHHQSDAFTRRDGYTGTEAREESKTVDLFYKFRQFKPYLLSRLKKIHADRKERELREEIDDIKYFLSVMSDMLADENHGSEALQGFIDRIHEMVRRNPLSETAYTDSDNDNETEEPAAPRSPSPTEVTFDSLGGPPTTARTIPLERKTNPEFHYFDSIESKGLSINTFLNESVGGSIERGIHDKKRARPKPKDSWDPDDTTFSGDVDMRGESVFHPTSNSGPLGPGQQRSSHWEESNGGFRSFGRGVGRDAPLDENYYNWEARHDGKSSQGYRREEHFKDTKTAADEPWGASQRPASYSFGRGKPISEDYTRQPTFPPERQEFSRDYHHREPEHSFDRSPTFSRDPTFRSREPPRPEPGNDSMFERRQPQQFERRRTPSASYENESTHIDYNHGSADDQWSRGSTSTNSERDIRYAQVNAPASGFNAHVPAHFQQPNLNYGLNQCMQNPVINPGMSAANMGISRIPNIPINVSNPGVVQNSRTTHHHQSLSHTNGPQPSGVMGNRQVIPPNGAYNFPDPSSHPSISPIRSTSVAEPSDQLKEMFNKKAQQIFGGVGRPNHRRDNQNVPPPSSTSVHVPLKVTPPQKSPQNSLLATNQLLSDRDPRLQKLNKKVTTSVNSASQNEPHEHYSKSSKDSHPSTSNNHKRNEHDPRLLRRERSELDPRDKNNRQKHAEHSHGSERSREDKSNRERENDNRDRVARVNLDGPDPLPSKRGIDDARNRVKSRLSSLEQNKPPPSSKLQEIRKQVEKEGPHPLGRNPAKKHSSFDEAIVVPIETPTRPPPKDSSKAVPKTRDSSKETDVPGSHKETQKDKVKEKEKIKESKVSPQSKGGRQKGLRNSGENKKQSSKPKNKRNQKSQNVPSSSENSENSSLPPKKPVFRIPKIKKPDPPPSAPSPLSPPKSPSPEPQGILPEPSLSNTSEDSLSDVAKDKMRLITDDFIKQFIIAEAGDKADKLLSNTVAISSLKERLRDQIKLMFNKDGGDSTPVPDKKETEAEPELETTEPSTDAGGHQSRSTVKKRNSKRRSSLEKLHDALKEMRFDMALPLGPRRCTRGPAADLVEASPAIAGGNDAAHVSAEQVSSVTTKQVTKSSGIMGSNNSTSVSVNGTGEELPKTGAKRGRKRKRKASKVGSNKKKKGPVTRAQLAVKSALKVQQKDKPHGSTQLHDTRVTRSMMGAPIKINIKMERVKDEPVDVPDDDCITFGTGFEHLETDTTSHPEVGLSEEEINAGLAAINIELNSFDDGDERMSIQSIDIKSEADSDHGQIDQIVEDGSVQHIPEPQDSEMEQQIKTEKVDTDYNTDLTEFLPDIPTIDSVYSTCDTTSAMDGILNQIESQDIKPFPEPILPVETAQEIRNVCFEMMDKLLNDVEDGEAMELEVQENTVNEDMSITTQPDTLGKNQPPIQLAESESEYDSEEPNDFYQLSDHEEKEELVDANSESEVSMMPQYEYKPMTLDELREKLLGPQKDDTLERLPPPPITEENIALQELHSQRFNELNRKLESGEFSNELLARQENRRQLPTSDPTILDPEAQAGKVTNMRGRDLYKCPNTPCTFNASNSTLFKDHVTVCTFSPDAKSFGCPHCDKRVKAVVNLLDHLKTHGRQQQLCAICSYRTWATSELTRHLKSYHKVYNTKLEKMESQNLDDDPEYVMFPKDVASRISSSQELKECYARYADRLVFGPDDIDKVPNRQIFHTLAYCSSCTYSSKVRINFVRHLQAHKEADVNPEVDIPKSDPVNPVPCLDRKEMMFDKMTNWAGSSHENKQGNANSDSSSLPQFISDQFRYVCCVQGCEQITVDEYMLRTHIRTLHPEVEMYNCPHCAKHDATRNDKRNTVPVEKLGNHLKLHGPKLYRCAYCDVIHTQVILMEKHIPEKHPERKPIHYLIRNVDSDGNTANSNRRSSTEENVLADKWRCTLCSTKQLFTTYKDVKNHCAQTHRIYSQFICLKCKHTTDGDTSIINHIVEDCQKDSTVPSVLIMWYRNEFDAKPDDIVHGPLWKRSTSIKHIRGIFLEDAKMPKLEKQEPLFSPKSSGDSPAKNGASGAIVKKVKSPAVLAINGDKTVSDMTSPGLMYTCPKCNIFKTKNANNMRVHLYNEMGYQRYRCTTCNVKFITESSLKGHITGDHGAEFASISFELLPMNAEIEAFINTFFESEEQSVTVKKEPSPTSSTETTIKASMFSCKHCSQECQTAHNLKTHVLAKHLASDRYTCGHCKGTFWNDALVRNHHSRLHEGLPILIEEKPGFGRLLTPEFWAVEYGIPMKKSKKASIIEDDFRLDPSVSSSDTTLLAATNFKEFESPDDDALLFDLGNVNSDSILMEDDQLGGMSVNNGSADDTFVQQLLQGESGNQSGLINRGPNNAFAYKCFHCGENSLSVRGARSHWEKVHSNRPEERCNYFEYKSFNQMNDLPPCIQLACSLCDYSVSCLSVMHDHHDRSHASHAFRMKRKLRVGVMIYECTFCFHESSSLEQICEHTRITHPTQSEPEYTISDLQQKIKDHPSYFMGKLVEDTVRYQCDDPTCAFEFESQNAVKSHMLSAHGIIGRKIGIKYTRYVINSLVRVPVDDEGSQPAMVFQCPKCDFQSEEKQKLVMEHLNEHVHTYLCPQCDWSFRSYLDTKFHIRLQHADPSGTPLINRDMVKAREQLEKSITQVHATILGKKNSLSA